MTRTKKDPLRPLTNSERGALERLARSQSAPGEAAILTEGEFHALLLWQEAGDLVGVATLGSCSRGVSPKALRYLLGCLRLLVAYDVDAEGDKGAERMQRLSTRMQRVRSPVGKDVTAFWQAGGRVRDWVLFELARQRRC